MPQLIKGTGRPVFMLLLDEIKADMRLGVFVKDIFRKHEAALGIGYKSFCKLVNRYAADAKPTITDLSQPKHRIVKRLAVSPSPAIPQFSGDTDARRERALPGPRTFTYDGNPKQDDDALITGSKPGKD